MVCHSDCKDHLNQRLHACNFLTLRNKESVIVVFELLSLAINVHTLRKNGEIKTVSVLTRRPSSLVP